METVSQFSALVICYVTGAGLTYFYLHYYFLPDRDATKLWLVTIFWPTYLTISIVVFFVFGMVCFVRVIVTGIIEVVKWVKATIKGYL